MFLKQLSETSVPVKILNELNLIVDKFTWNNGNQIGLKHRPGTSDVWFDGIGSLYDKEKNKRLYSESDFSEWSIGKDNYVRQQIEILEEKYKFKSGRVRFMRLMPHHGLSVHKDSEFRYHLVLKTNPFAYIAHNSIEKYSDKSDLLSTSLCYHLPMNGHWFKIDTRETHWVYNGGQDERIHLVVCGD